MNYVNELEKVVQKLIEEKWKLEWENENLEKQLVQCIAIIRFLTDDLPDEPQKGYYLRN